MRNASDVLLALGERGITVRVEAGQLRIKTREAKLRPEELAEIRSLKGEIIQLLTSTQSVMDLPIERRPVGTSAPLTRSQVSVWKWVANGGASVRICSFAMRFLGRLDISLLQKSLEALLERHESLRTTIRSVDGSLCQHVDVVREQRLTVVDVRPRPAMSVVQEAQRLASNFVEKEIDPLTEPLFDYQLLRLDECDHVLVIAIDHLVADAESLRLIDQELATLYKRGLHGLLLELGPLPIQFGDYALWQRRTYAAWLEQHGSYWKSRLTDFQSVPIPTNAGGGNGTPTGAEFQIRLGEGLSLGLQELARQEHTLLALVVFIIYAAAMSKWCHSNELVVWFANAGRDRLGLQGTVGPLTEFLPLRVRIGAEDTFIALLERATQDFFSAQNHPSFGMIEDVCPHVPVEIPFNWTRVNWAEGIIGCEHVLDSELRVSPFPLFRTPRPFKFTTVFAATQTNVVATFWYRPDLLPPQTLEWFGRALQLFAREFVSCPRTRVASIPCSPP